MEASLEARNTTGNLDRAKIEVDIEQNVFLVYPRQSILVTSKDVDGRANIATVAWSTVLSTRPPLHGIALAPQRHSHALIHASRKFIINVPDKSIMKQVVACGRTTGRVDDKFSTFDLTPLAPLALGPDGPPRIAECPVHVECIVRDEVKTGDHTLFIGEVVGCSANEDLVKNGLFLPNRFQIPFHLGGHEFCFNELKRHTY